MREKDKINILIAESAPVIAAGVAYWMHRLPGLQTHVTVVETQEEMDSYMRNSSPDIIAVSLSFSGIFNPIDFREKYGDDCKLMAILSGQISPSTLKLFNGCISVVDDVEHILKSVRDILSLTENSELTKESLSVREKEIVEWVVKGLTNKEIADKLFLSPHTVMTHRRNIARKLEIHSATGLTIYAIVNHIVELSDLNL
ncbi:MAG: response regulator transcription factor [Muribaculaceae bacterium]|nr:response regulator transcription factor [Muribaculaceae bacterium]